MNPFASFSLAEFKFKQGREEMNVIGCLKRKQETIHDVLLIGGFNSIEHLIGGVQIKTPRRLDLKIIVRCVECFLHS
jgi:hypothetical protein